MNHNFYDDVITFSHWYNTSSEQAQVRNTMKSLIAVPNIKDMNRQKRKSIIKNLASKDYSYTAIASALGLTYSQVYTTINPK